MLQKATTSPDITNYLTFILCSLPLSLNVGEEDAHLARSSAALSLKNIVKTRYAAIPTANLAYTRSAVLTCLEDPNLQIRSFAGNVITELVRSGGVLSWPEITLKLLSLASNEKGDVPSHVQEGAMSALAKVCEDNRKALDRVYHNERPLDVIFPRLLQVAASPNAKVRSMALETVNMFIPQKPQILLVHIDDVLERLFQLANDPDDEVRRYVL